MYCSSLACGGASLANAQAPTATLVGQVTDPSNAAVVGASVQVRDTATNLTRTTQTGRRASTPISDLPVGVFDVTISKPGSRNSLGQAWNLPPTRRRGWMRRCGSERAVETVAVTADVGLLNTETSTKGDVITPVEIAEIPLNGRDFNNLAFTVAGVQPSEVGAKGAPYVARRLARRFQRCVISTA